jgi:hypothetical protein
MVDCARPWGPQGCSGGWMHDAMSYIVERGQMREADYPYVGHEQNCNEGAPFMRISSRAMVDSNSDASLAAHVQ